VDLPITIGVVCYGNHVELARRFVTSLYRNTDAKLFSLRVGLNAVEPATEHLFREFSENYGNVEIFVEKENIYKNPMMGRMIRERPLETTWTIWCDDDTYFTEPDWLQRLGTRIASEPGIAQWGHRFLMWRHDQQILDWIQKATWYRAVPFKRTEDARAKGDVEFIFATGGYWAARTDALKFLDWPDRRLIQAGEDFILGEALRQNGYKIGDFHHGVKINDAPRRNADAPQVREICFDVG
jgi:GT2 family glycosyltransferase